MPEIDTDFQMFESIVKGLSKHLFPSGSIRNEASDIEVSAKLLGNDDIGRFLTPEFIDRLKSKLRKKASGIMKQAEIERAGFSKISEQYSNFEEDEKE